MNVMIPEIPQEIICAVIESLEYPKDIDTWKSCSLVCRTWRPVAQQCIHRQYTYRSEKSFGSCLLGASEPPTFASMIPYPNILRYIRSFRILGTSYRCLSSPPLLQKIISHLARVANVDIGSLSMDDLPPSYGGIPELFHLPTISSVHLADSVLRPVDAEALFENSSSLKYLKLTRTEFWESDFPERQRSQSPSHLRSLDIQLSSKSLGAFQSWVLHSGSSVSLARLKVLRLRDATGPRIKELGPLFDAVMSSLERLEYEQTAKGSVNSFGNADGQWDEFPDSIENLNLRSLLVSGYFSSDSTAQKILSFVNVATRRSARLDFVELDFIVLHADYSDAYSWLGIEQVQGEVRTVGKEVSIELFMVTEGSESCIWVSKEDKRFSRSTKALLKLRLL
ncbi:uncharacterized protein BT62DRAFT_246066 [Guyanagaster necrorhizus]|uniref:F-box domain-containing protein n=1 Tax=Guyanagaster necrorhizus TaxID=856835 RepID=A0A9P8AQX9_9AGAR|nr:uncharacterized protein BT62DRAFT_246066 [Guyanagaster necrorhizus MCA 3950]KAG7444485.1 hypothetical protein BT62DRAFT_246066 [Guyanagaster necrorhizus MCA 3950]